MLEKAISGPKSYVAWVLVLLVILGIGFANYLRQLVFGLGITGMSRSVSWGLYIGQFTFLVGVAASAVMLVMPYYLHNFKKFGKITILGEFLAVASVIMCITFVTVDLGRPDRAVNIFLYPTPNSVLFWDFVVLSGYLLLNIVIGWTVLGCERRGVPPATWTKVLIYVSIPWAISIHTVTAFLYAGLPGRGFWLTAIMAPRFLGSAFACGPALLILFCMFLRKYTKFDAGWEAIQALAKISAYAMVASVFFFLCELFTVYYSQIPGHMTHFEYLFAGLQGVGNLRPLMWVCVTLAIIAAILMVLPQTRNSETWLPVGCATVFFSLWMEKGIALVVGGFIPNPMEVVYQYTPTLPELSITLGVWALGFLILTILYKVALGVRAELDAGSVSVNAPK